MRQIIHAACPHDCPDACGVLITIDDGRATRIQGDPQHPVTRGFLCAKVAKYLDRVYSPDRVLYPMRRVAKKGAGARGAADFERITWDAAFDEICTRFRRLSQEFGPEAILPYSYGGTLGVLMGGSMDRRFFHRLGASQLKRTICSTAGSEALASLFGAKLGAQPEQFRHSRLILAWGANIHGNNIHLWPFIEEARRAGGKLVVIDPYKTRTAALADWYLPIHPGTDAALALAMMHVIINERLYDAEYVAAHTLGFEQLRERVQQYPPGEVADITGIAAEDIIRLSREYAGTRPAAIRLNYGVQRTDNGGMAVRAVAMLPCLTGSWKDAGGGLQLSTSGGFPLRRDLLERPDLMERSPLGRPARWVNMIEIGRALLELDSPPIKALFVYNSNPVAVAPNHNLVVRGFAREDLFTVVHEQFFTDTCDYADMVLPATTFFEHKDLVSSYGHYYLQASLRAIPPRGECVSNFDLFRELAHRMAFEEECFEETVDQAIDAALASSHEWLKGIDRERLEREPHVRVNVPELPFADGRFLTPSGKAEFYSERLAGQGLDPVISFTPPAESRRAATARNYPLELLARKADNFLNSTFCNLPSHQPLEEAGLLEMSVADAAPRGIGNGDRVRVFNRRGALQFTARVNGAVRPGVVAAQLNWAKLAPGGSNINALTSERSSDMGGATFYSVLVEVERA